MINKYKILTNTMIAISAMYSVVLGITNLGDMVVWNIIFTAPIIVLSADEKQ